MEATSADWSPAELLVELTIACRGEKGQSQQRKHVGEERKATHEQLPAWQGQLPVACVAAGTRSMPKLPCVLMQPPAAATRVQAPAATRTCTTAVCVVAYMLGMAAAARRRPLALVALMLTSTASVALTARPAACSVAASPVSSWLPLEVLQGEREVPVRRTTRE